MPDDRPYRPQPQRDRYPRPPFAGGQRPAGGPAGAPRPAFAPRPFPPPAEPPSSVRLRDGDREVDVHGSPLFCRQILDELPALLARLRGEAPATSAAIALPPASAPPPPPAAAPPVAAEAPPARGNGVGAKNGSAVANGHGADLESQVLRVLRTAGRPVGIADIRRQLPGGVSGQAVRRVLERTDRVVNTGGRPAAYKLR